MQLNWNRKLIISLGLGFVNKPRLDSSPLSLCEVPSVRGISRLFLRVLTAAWTEIFKPVPVVSLTTWASSFLLIAVKCIVNTQNFISIMVSI